MSQAEVGVIKDSFKEAVRLVSAPANEDDISRFLVQIINACDKIGYTRYSMSPNQIGRCRGDWFELAIEKVLGHFFSQNDFKAYPGRGHSITEIKGFQDVSWIPMPDAIFRSPMDFRALLSLKWGMRHDRMYEVGYEAYAIKDWLSRNNLPSIKVFLATNDEFSGFESRLETMSRCPVIDDVYYVSHDRLSSALKLEVRSIPQLINDIRQIVS